MRIMHLVFCIFILSFVSGQTSEIDWYCETNTDGVNIQNSYPKGGRYPGVTKYNNNNSYLVFFTRITNESPHPIEIEIDFTADSHAIPNSPFTFMKLFLPKDTMTLDKVSAYSYGITELESFENPTNYHAQLNPNENCLFYVVAFFYQSEQDKWRDYRGGNRAEFALIEDELYFSIEPQVSSLKCGKVTVCR